MPKTTQPTTTMTKRRIVIIIISAVLTSLAGMGATALFKNYQNHGSAFAFKDKEPEKKPAGAELLPITGDLGRAIVFPQSNFDRLEPFDCKGDSDAAFRELIARVNSWVQKNQGKYQPAGFYAFSEKGKTRFVLAYKSTGKK